MQMLPRLLVDACFLCQCSLTCLLLFLVKTGAASPTTRLGGLHERRQRANVLRTRAVVRGTLLRQKVGTRQNTGLGRVVWPEGRTSVRGLRQGTERAARETRAWHRVASLPSESALMMMHQVTVSKQHN